MIGLGEHIAVIGSQSRKRVDLKGLADEVGASLLQRFTTLQVSHACAAATAGSGVMLQRAVGAGPSSSGHRRRGRAGSKLTEVTPAVIELLIKGEWLSPAEAADERAITQALSRQQRL
jgi:hypothetical protein